MAIKRGSKVDMSSSSASMTDLMFLLLIFLMIATTLINSNALKLTLPRSTSLSKDKVAVLVSIDAQERCYIGDTEIAFGELEAALERELADADEKRISLRADEAVSWGRVVFVMNIAKNNHYKLDAATSPE